MRKLALMLAQCLLLAGCTGLPRPREMGDMALLRTVGVDAGESGVTLTGSTGQRASGVEGQKEAALVLSGEGVSLTAAALDLRRKGDSDAFFGYVDNLLVGEGELSDLLGWLARDGELGLGAKLWLLRDESAAAAIGTGGEEGVERRLSALEQGGKLGTGPMTRTAGEVCISLLERGCAFVPVLTGAEELTEAGYALLSGDRTAAVLTGDAARGLELLAEKPGADVIEVALAENRVSVRLTGGQLDCRPRFEDGKLTKLELTSRVSGELAQWQREPTPEQRREICAAAEGVLAEWMRLALHEMARWRCECVGIGSRVAMAAPWHRGELEENWQEAFAAAEIEVKVELAVF